MCSRWCVVVRERGERPDNPVPPAPPAAVSRPLPIDWWKLDPEERTETLEVLFKWVPQLVRRYGLTESEVPPCWFRHEALVQELLAAFQYRQQMQFNEAMGSPPSAPFDFHYQFQLALQRLRGWTSRTGCNAGEHQETVVQPWALLGSTAAASWEVDTYEYLMEAQAVWAEQEEPEEQEESEE